MADIKYQNEIENPNINRENCFNNENFAIICAFFEKFESQINVELPNFVKLQEWLENTEELHQGLKDLHIKLLRKLRKIVHETAWETALSKFCYSYSAQDAWEIERFGYKKSGLQVKLRVLKELLENQFERNGKLRNVMQNLTGIELRGNPIGHDKLGHAYWLTQDKDCNIRIYQEHLDEDIWQVVATNRNELIKLIQRLRGNEVVISSQLSTIDEDTSSSNNSAPVIKLPPPEERDESQDATDQFSSSNKEIEEKIPNLKIRLNEKNEGKIESSVDERKVKPLVISQSKITTTAETKPPVMPPKKRILEEECRQGEESEEDKNLVPTVKRFRPTLLDAKREKINRYEKFKDESDQDDLDEEEDEEDESEECEEEEYEEDDEQEGEEETEEEMEDVNEAKASEVVGEAIEDKVMIVKGEGSGKDCEGIFFLKSILDEKFEVGDVIEEEIMYVFGEGTGKDCMVGNDEVKIDSEKTNTPSPVFYFGQPGCLKLSPLKLKRTDVELLQVTDDSLKNNTQETDLEKELREDKNGNIGLENNDVSNKAGGSTNICSKNDEMTKNTYEELCEQSLGEDKLDKVEDKNEILPLVEDNPIDYTSKTKKQLACSNKKNLELKNHIDSLGNELILEKVISNDIVHVNKEDEVTSVQQNILREEKDHINDLDVPKNPKEKLLKDLNINSNDLNNIESVQNDTIVSDGKNYATGKIDEMIVKNDNSVGDDIFKTKSNANNIPIEKEERNALYSSESKNIAVSECDKYPFDSKDANIKVIECENIKSSHEKCASGSSSNRKRRLSAEKVPNLLRQISESETDLNSENVEEFVELESETDDVGGKRARMRCKIVNTKIRKKVEATKELARGSRSSSSSDEDNPQKKPIAKKSNSVSPRSLDDQFKDTPELKSCDEHTLNIHNLSKDNKSICTPPKKLAAKIEFLKQTQEAALVSTVKSEKLSEISTGSLIKTQYTGSCIIPKKRISPKKIEDKIAELKQNITKECSQILPTKLQDDSQECRKRSNPLKETVVKDTTEHVDNTSAGNKIKREVDEVPRKRTISEEIDNSSNILNLTVKSKNMEEKELDLLAEAVNFEKGPSKKRLVQDEITSNLLNESSCKNDCNLPIKKKVSSKLLNAIKNIEERKLKLDQTIINKLDDTISENKIVEEDISLKINTPSSPSTEDRSRKRNITDKFSLLSDESLTELKKEKIEDFKVEEKTTTHNASDNEEKGKIRIVVKTCSDAITIPNVTQKDALKINNIETDIGDTKINKDSSPTSADLQIKIRATRRGAPPPGSLAESSFEAHIQTKRKGRHSGTTTSQKTSVPKKAKKTDNIEEIFNEMTQSPPVDSDHNLEEFNQKIEAIQSKPQEETETKHEKEIDEDAVKSSEQEEENITPAVNKKVNSEPKQDVPKQQRRKREIDISNIIETENDVTPMRQSRRIAQLKIREEAERRKMEEIALKKMKEDLKKRKKEEKKQLDVDPTVSEPSSSDESISEEDSKKKRLLSHKKKGNKKGWSSGTEDDDHEQDADEDLLFRYPPSDHGSPLFHSDHEFSCESDLEDESQAVPMKRARTARKEGEEINQTQLDIDESCQKCGKGDHPEWILLCDNCDKGYHCSCLSPVLFIIPEGDWFCPPCQQEQLIVALEAHLKEFDELVEQKKVEEQERIRNEEIEARERERELELEALEAAEHALEIKLKKSHGTKSRRRKASEEDHTEQNEDSDSEVSSNENPEKKKRIISRNERNCKERRKKFSSSSSKSSSTSSAATDSDDEPIYKLRKRRQVNVSYRYNDYDDLINRAIKEEMDAEAGAGNLGRGKDITTIIEADKEEKARLKNHHETSDTEEKENEEESVKESNDEPINKSSLEKKIKKIEENENNEDDDNSTDNNNEDDDYENDNENENENKNKSKSKSVPRRKKKSRKLNSLDIDSDDDGSDEDFQTSSESEESESFSVSSGSDSSLEEFRRKNKKGKKVRRAARDRRKLRDFVVEESDDDSDDDRRRKSKKKRPKYSDFTESDLDDEDSSASEDLGSSELCDDSTDSKSDDGAWRPGKHKKQKQTKKKSNNNKSQTAIKPKVYVKPKKKPDNDGEKSFKASGIKKKAKEAYGDNESSDSGTERKKTRGRRLFYIDDFDDEESSDGGIKPGVKRPDTPPEERERFIKKQEEIKRQLAEKKAAEAKAEIENSSKMNPQKTDSLSTVPLSVIRAAKALDVDYLQRRGEDIPTDEEDDINEEDAAAAFGDALPDDLPDDMDEEAIAKMMEEEDFAQNQLKFPSGELIKSNKRNINMIPKSIIQSNTDRIPIAMSQTRNINATNQNLTLLQSALTQPPRPFQPSRTQLEAHLQIPKQLHQNAPEALVVGNAETTPVGKPRGRRKKITPLRDPQEKAAAAAAANPPSKTPTKDQIKTVIHSVAAIPLTTQHLPTNANLNVAQPPQLYKPSGNNAQPSVITRMPQLPPRARFPEQVSRYFSAEQLRPPLRHGILNPHHILRTPYPPNGPPPLRSGLPQGNSPVNLIRQALNPKQSQFLPEPFRSRLSSAHLSSYRPPMYGNPGYPPPPQHPGSYPPGPYGSFYTPPPPPLAAHSSQRLTHTGIPSSVIVAAPPSSSHPPPTSSSSASSAVIHHSPSTILRKTSSALPPPPTIKSSTILETFDSKRTSPTTIQEDELNTNADNPNQITNQASSSEFSGLVSYFSSQHDDFNS